MHVVKLSSNTITMMIVFILLFFRQTHTCKNIVLYVQSVKHINLEFFRYYVGQKAMFDGDFKKGWCYNLIKEYNISLIVWQSVQQSFHLIRIYGNWC